MPKKQARSGRERPGVTNDDPLLSRGPRVAERNTADIEESFVLSHQACWLNCDPKSSSHEQSDRVAVRNLISKKRRLNGSLRRASNLRLEHRIHGHSDDFVISQICKRDRVAGGK